MHFKDSISIIFSLQAIPKQIADKMEMMNEAISAGTTFHADSVHKVIDHYREILAIPVEESTFYKPIKTKLSQVEGKSDGKNLTRDPKRQSKVSISLINKKSFEGSWVKRANYRKIKTKR